MPEQRRAPRRPRARPLRARLVAGAVAALLAPGILAACAPAPIETAAGLGAVTAQRDRVAEQAHERSMQRLAEFVRAKWGPVSLPEVVVERWVDYGEWGGLMSECLASAGFPGARAADEGERIDYSGVDVDSPRELFDVDVATYACQGRFPVRSWFVDSVRGVELPWAYEYATSELPACLARHGWAVAEAPPSQEFAATWRTDDAYDPYALVGPDPLERAAASARCPAPEVLLDGASR
ncbi:hypothetical protein [Yonghaparkia sp. Root332]|uniref:hypothetical protein n=1 Tax=Yonghaparkia sp. Root332 TaxID=1736516 RepID=UPI0012E36B47|nr:hypothetical protein [Yonghaparkia sp. Root332]